MFFATIWFVKTSTRIVKHESRVVKSSPEAELRAPTQSSGESFRILMQALFSADVLKKVPERQYVFKFFFYWNRPSLRQYELKVYPVYKTGI